MATKPDAFFETFKARWKLATNAEQDQRQNELADLEFEAGDHWDPKIKSDRLKAGKPALTIDLLSGPIKQVTNQQRLARPGIKIAPVGHGTDTKKAEYWQSIVRRVERLSQASRAYAWAGWHQARMGRGFWVVRSEWVGDGFDQDIRIYEVDNQHTVYLDPTPKKLDGSDKKWGVIFEDLIHEDYLERFGETDLGDAIHSKAWQGLGDTPPDWITSKHCRIAEYYYLETEAKTRHLFDDGSTAWDDELEHDTTKQGRKKVTVPVPPDGLTILQSRDIPQTKVHRCLLNGMGEKLDSGIIPGEYIPIVKVYGERRNIDGKVDERGMVRMAKDASRMEDWAETSLMESMSKAKTAPWLIPLEAVDDGLRKMWETSNRVDYAALFYKMYDAQGRQLEKPNRIPSGVDVSAFTLAAQRMENHVRSQMGNSDVYRDETASEQGKLSGRAINMRRLQQELGTSDYMENLGDGIVLTAKIIMSMAREIYDTPRVMRIVGADEQDRPIVTYLGEDQKPAAEEKAQAEGIDVEELFDLSGHPEDYDIAISPGKRHDTARQETVEILSEIAPKSPPEFQGPMYLALLKNLDGPGIPELAAELDPKKRNDIPPHIQRELEMLKQQLQQAITIIETDQVKQQAQLDKATMDNATRLAIEELKAGNELTRQRLEEKFELITLRLEQMHESRIAGVNAQQAAQQAEQGHAHASAEADQGHQQALTESEQANEHAKQQAAMGHASAMRQLEAKPKPNGASA
jgi:hypothetical protein